MLGNDTMPAMNNNVNSGLKFLGFGEKLRREKKTGNEEREQRISRLYPYNQIISSGGAKKDKILFCNICRFHYSIFEMNATTQLGLELSSDLGKECKFPYFRLFCLLFTS